MDTSRSVTRGWLAQHPQAMKARDAVIHFHSLSPELVEVSETVEGKSICKHTVQRDIDVVTELEKKYLFFANEAEIARKLVARGGSCVLSLLSGALASAN